MDKESYRGTCSRLKRKEKKKRVKKKEEKEDRKRRKKRRKENLYAFEYQLRGSPNEITFSTNRLLHRAFFLHHRIHVFANDMPYITPK
jgi:hypothetical protein